MSNPTSSPVHSSPVHLDPMTPLGLLERTLRVFPDKTALVYGETRWSYTRFAQEAGRLAGALRRAGIAPGDRVAFLTPNVPELLLAHFAVLQVGAAWPSTPGCRRPRSATS
jgi:fatty-acyl-CoA synthase